MRGSRILAAERPQIIAQGFSPGIRPPSESALKGRPIWIAGESSGAYRFASRHCQWFGTSSLQLNGASRSSATFRAPLYDTSNPGLKPWAEICNRFAVKAVPLPIA